MELGPEWKPIEVSRRPGIVYVLQIAKDDEDFRPFYVGKSGARNIGRLGDYVSCKHTAQTDFNVGTALRYLVKKGYRYTFHYRASEHPGADESALIDKSLATGFTLNQRTVGVRL